MAGVQVIDQPTERGRASRRAGRLQRAVRGVRSRWDRHRAIELVAVAMIPSGVVAVLLGWYGAARTPFLFEQVPYAISGGLLGIGLLASGGALYVGSWIARAAAQGREQHEELLGAVEALRDELARRSVHDTSEIAVVRAGAYVATPRGSMYHEPDCAVVAGRDDVRVVDPVADDLAPCGLCVDASPGS